MSSRFLSREKSRANNLIAARAVDVMSRAKRIDILIIDVNKFFFLFSFPRGVFNERVRCRVEHEM